MAKKKGTKGRTGKIARLMMPRGCDRCGLTAVAGEVHEMRDCIKLLRESNERYREHLSSATDRILEVGTERDELREQAGLNADMLRIIRIALNRTNVYPPLRSLEEVTRMTCKETDTEEDNPNKEGKRRGGS